MLQRGEDQGLCVCVCVCCPWGAEDGAGIEKNSHIAVYCSYFCCYCWLGFLCCFGVFFFFFLVEEVVVWFGLRGFFVCLFVLGFRKGLSMKLGPKTLNCYYLSRNTFFLTVVNIVIIKPITILLFEKLSIEKSHFHLTHEEGRPKEF